MSACLNCVRCEDECKHFVNEEDGVVIDVFLVIFLDGLNFACYPVLFAFSSCVSFPFPFGLRFSGGKDVVSDERVRDL